MPTGIGLLGACGSGEWVASIFAAVENSLGARVSARHSIDLRAPFNY